MNQDLGRTISNRASRGTPARRVARHWATGTFTPSRTGRSQRCHVIDHRVRADDQASSPRLRIQLWWNRMPCPNISPVASAMPRPPDQVRGHCSPAQRRWQPRARCQRALSRLPEGQFSHALGSARARRACTRAVPPTDDRHATGRITDPGCLQRPVSPSLPTCAPFSMLSTPAPSTQVRYEIHGSRIANRSRHHMRYDRATALDRHVTTSLSPHRRHSRASAGGVGHALAAYRSG